MDLILQYENFPSKHPLPANDVEARAMGCTIFCGYVVHKTTHEITATVTYWYNYRPCVKTRSQKK